MPVAFAMKFRMSRMLVLVNRISGSTSLSLMSGGGPACRACSRSCAMLLDGRASYLLADAPLDLLDLRRKLPVRRVEVAGAAVLAQRLFEFAARLGQLRLVQVLVRGVDHRALERNLVVGSGRAFPAPLSGRYSTAASQSPARAAFSARPYDREAPHPAAVKANAMTTIHFNQCTRIIVPRVESSGGPVRRHTRDRPIPRRFSEGGNDHR